MRQDAGVSRLDNMSGSTCEATLLITSADAWRLGNAMVAAAIERALLVTIGIRRHGQ
jgi:hypothetical protein